MVPKFFIRTGLIRGVIQKIISGIFPILKGFDKPIERFVKGDISGIIVFVRRPHRRVGSEYIERFHVSWVAG